MWVLATTTLKNIGAEAPTVAMLTGTLNHGYPKKVNIMNFFYSEEKFDNKMKLNLFFRRLFPLIPGDTPICWRYLASNSVAFHHQEEKEHPVRSYIRRGTNL